VGDDDTEPYAFGIKPLKVERNGDVVALGALYVSGDVIVQWRPSAFPEVERTQNHVTSHYDSVSDAETATSGTLVFESEEVWHGD